MSAAVAARRAYWQAEGRRTAESLQQVSAAVVVGRDLEAAALVARGVALGTMATRPVALGDLAGDLTPLYELAGGEDAQGLTDCFRDGLPLNAIARPATSSGTLFILPSGTPPVAIPEIFAHPRWPRLVAGFTQSGALLLLVAPVDAPGLDELIGVTSGVIAVDATRESVRHFRVLAAVSAPEPVPEWQGVPRPRVRSRLVAASLAAIALGALAWKARPGRPTAADAATSATRAASAPITSAAARASPPPAITDAVHVDAPPVPADSLLLAPFAVEVVAASSISGANSLFANHQDAASLRGATISPVTVGTGSTLWYKIVVGACPDRACADGLLIALRRDAVARGDRGRVVRLPYALLLADHVERVDVSRLVRAWSGRGVMPYALLQRDGSVRLMAGAFETPAQAAPLASAVHDGRVAAAVAFRTGRMF